MNTWIKWFGLSAVVGMGLLLVYPQTAAAQSLYVAPGFVSFGYSPYTSYYYGASPGYYDPGYYAPGYYNPGFYGYIQPRFNYYSRPPMVYRSYYGPYYYRGPRVRFYGW